MAGYQTEILTFAVKWAPFDDGGDEHVLPTFGLTISDYYRRLLASLESPAAKAIDPATIRRLRHRSHQRLRARD